MAPSVSQRQPSPEVRSYDGLRPRPAKAVLPGPAVGFSQTGTLIWEVLVKGHGSVKAAAFTMGQTDPSLLRRQVLDGTLPLKKLMEADPRALVTFGEFLVEHFGEKSKSKAQLAREKLPELLATILDIVDEAK